MLEAARRRQFDEPLVWRYDRFARSMHELVNALAEFERPSIDFNSYNEGADTTTSQGKLLFGIMTSLAEFERSLTARVCGPWARELWPEHQTTDGPQTFAPSTMLR
jgi:DNA invertase Pin-like site-specific DNA recombinase